MTTSELLRQAAEEVRRGWCRGLLHDESGNVCAIGALQNAAGGRRYLAAETFGLPRAVAEPRLMVLRALTRALGLAVAECKDLDKDVLWNRHWYEIVLWNNASDQTQENVAAAFELAAVLEEERERAEAPAVEALA